MIKVENLVKSFGATRAVDGVSFEVGRGEVLGFLGPNGAGKSTTMRMITGFLPPSAGRVSVCGFDVEQDPLEAKRRIGYLPEAAPSYHEMSVVSFLKFAAEMRGLTGQARRKAIANVVDICHLQGVLGQSIETLSKGFKHRTCLAQSIIHDPEVLILDEPTDGLDPNQKHEVRELIKRMGARKAIIFSTHILEEVEAACSRAIIIDRGRIVANGTPAELKAMSQTAGAVSMTLCGAAEQQVREKLALLPLVGRLEASAQPQERLTVRAFPGRSEDAAARGGSLAAALAQAAVREQWKIEDLRTEEGRLEDVFRSITRTDIHLEEKAA
ncbi:MAG: ATP-binding cassette domain-containing protein [Burkholderiales bacterium]|nr:ATP-binding cassette domain-containing protein [Burkholderiales bacterium]